MHLYLGFNLINYMVVSRMVWQINGIECKNLEKINTNKYLSYLPFKKIDFLTCQARWIKYLNIEKECIRVTKWNIGKYLNYLRIIKCFFKKEQSQKP